MESLNRLIISSIIRAADAAIPRCKKKCQKAIPDEVLDKIKLKRRMRREFILSRDKTLKNRINSITNDIHSRIKEHNNSNWDKFLKSIGKDKFSTRKL